MGLDYSKGCVNVRDVGECVNRLADSTLVPPGRILRGGKLDFVRTAAEIGCPGTIINLRMGPDTEDCRFGAAYWQFAIPNHDEKYDTTDPAVRRWLSEVFTCLATEVARFPVLLHCTSGKDRTGVVGAALLTVLGIERARVVQEYLWSAGEVQRAWIERSLDGIGDPVAYFRRVDLGELRRRLVGDGSPSSSADSRVPINRT